jgi:hypothetical protein
VFRSRSNESRQTRPPSDAPEAAERPVRDPQAPKGRPTPKRSEAEALRRATVKPPTNRKEAAKRAKEARRAALAKQREALMTGDERYLPVRDRGPVRRYVRDFVDTKWHVAEYFLPIAVIILVMSMLPAQQAVALLMWMAVILMIIFDSVFSSFRLKRALRQHYPDESHKGAVAYALMRTLQMRRMRLPKPQIKRGEPPRI